MIAERDGQAATLSQHGKPKEPSAATGNEQESVADNEKMLEHIGKLHRDYKHRLVFRNERARKIVNDFPLSCGDHRMFFLIDFLYARLSAYDLKKSWLTEQSWLTTAVDSRGDRVRIMDTFVRTDGSKGPTLVTMEINEWGELRTIDLSADAVLDYGCSRVGLVLPR